MKAKTDKKIKTKKFPFLIVSILMSLGIFFGVLIGSYWHLPIVSINYLPNNIIFCPPEDLVQENQSNPSTFMTENLKWNVYFQGWDAPDKIGFMQALINEENNLVCYYQWTNPLEKSSKLWMTVQLSPSVNQKISAYGSYWSEIKDNRSLCSAGISACALKID